MDLINNYFTFFWRSLPPRFDLQLWLESDSVFDTMRPSDLEDTIDDTCYLQKFYCEGNWFYSLSSQDGIFYSDVINTNYDLEALQKDIHKKYINMFNLVKLISHAKPKNS